VGRWKTADKPDMPIGLPVSAYTNREYGAIVYGRGPLFFEALAQKLGAGQMDAFLADYVRANAWKIATGAGLKALAEQHCGCDLGPLWQQWVNP
jgi:aminopeptidase N